MWYIYKKSTKQVLGPVDAAQVQRWLKDGTIQVDDLAAAGPTGPWSSLNDLLGGSFRGTPPASVPSGPTDPTGTSSALPARVPGAKMPARNLAADPEFLRRQRLRSRQRARRVTMGLLIGAAGLFVVFVVVLIAPFAGWRRTESPGKTLAKAEMMEDPALEVAKRAAGDIGDLAKLIGSKDRVERDGTRRSASSAEGTTTRLFAQASAAFGGTAEKLRDVRKNVEMRIEGVRLDYPRLRAGQQTFRTRSPYLMIRVRITNLDRQQSVTYTPCHATKPSATLSWDGESEGLTPFQRRGFLIDGQQSGVIQLGPGQEAVDLYVFAAPPSSVTSVTLKIPGQAVGESEDFVFLLPMAEVLAGRQEGQDEMSRAGGRTESIEEPGIGPLTPGSDVPAQQAPPETPLETDQMPEEEAMPIPGIHEGGVTDAQAAPEIAVPDRELMRREEEVRRMAEQMQESLDRDRQRLRPSSPPRERRAR